MMDALRRWHVVNLPIAADSITKIEILTRRTPRKKRREPANRFKRLAPQRADAATDPFARYRFFECRRKSVWQRGANQFAGLESFDAAMQQPSIDAPKKRRIRERLIDQPAHGRAHFRIGPDGREEIFSPARIDFNVVVEQ